MQNYEATILEKYPFDIHSIRKVRGAVLCNTAQGFYLLKEVSAPAGHIITLQELYAKLADFGYENVDSIIPNQEGEYVTKAENGRCYLVKRWFSGRECDHRKPAEVLAAAGQLAKLHGCLKLPIENISTARRIGEEYRRHGRQLRKVRKFMRMKTSRTEFELEFLHCFDDLYRWAKTAEGLVEASGYDQLFAESMRENALVHGEYNYHNVLVNGEALPNQDRIQAVINFDRCKRDVQVEDLYYFLRKVMEKHGWKERLGDSMLNAYSAIRPLSEREIEYLKFRLVYPEKFWKIANSYDRSNKAWLSMKNMEKLETVIRQTKEKERFLENIFSFHL